MAVLRRVLLGGEATQAAEGGNPVAEQLLGLGWIDRLRRYRPPDPPPEPPKEWPRRWLDWLLRRHAPPVAANPLTRDVDQLIHALSEASRRAAVASDASDLGLGWRLL